MVEEVASRDDAKRGGRLTSWCVICELRRETRPVEEEAAMTRTLTFEGAKRGLEECAL